MKQYDVIVLGSGIAGAVTATILARQGFDVLILERKTHPRMAIGEGVVPATALWLFLLGEQYNVPEITTLCNLDSICKHVAPTSGVKRGFGFVYNEPGKPFNPDETTLILSPILPFMHEAHLYRKDVDYFLVNTAQKYGATYKDNAEISHVDNSDESVSVVCKDGGEYQGRFLIDASGHQSFVAKQFGFREDPPRQRHHSRAVFTHMRNVGVFEELFPQAGKPCANGQWQECTMHHVFDGGWMWIIAFNNHNKAMNQDVSVGVMVDPRKHPIQHDKTPAEELRSFIERFPTVQKHLRHAEPVMDTIRTDRVQYSSSRSTEKRIAMLHHAYGFVDPLFSPGIWRTLESVGATLSALIPALADNDFSEARFEFLNRMNASLLDDTDQLIDNAYRSTVSPETWNAYVKVWFADELMTLVPILRAAIKHIDKHDTSEIAELFGDPRPGSQLPFMHDLEQLQGHTDRVLDALEAGTIDSKEAASRLLAYMGSADWLPHNVHGWGKANTRHLDFSVQKVLQMTVWGRRKAPESLRHLFDYKLRTVFGLELRKNLLPGSVKRDAQGNIGSQAASLV